MQVKYKYLKIVFTGLDVLSYFPKLVVDHRIMVFTKHSSHTINFQIFQPHL